MMLVNLPRCAFTLLLFLCATHAAAAEAPRADTAAFEQQVAPLFAKFCLDCHGAEEPEANLSLAGVNPDLLTGPDLETWRLIDEQIRFGDMPPKGSAKPSEAERTALLAWIRGELLKTQLPGVVTEEKLFLPEFGNYVDHEALFGTRQAFVMPAAPRLWRLRPSIYETVIPRLSERVEGLATALNSADGSEIKDYSAAYFLDEPSTQQLLGNAKKIAEVQLGPNSKDRVFKALVSEEGPPAPGTVRSALELAFRKALGRAPSEEEQARFFAFYERSVSVAGYRSAARALLAAVLMQPEFLFRQELGAGEPDAHGRVRLAPAELGFALSYALENRPLDEFTGAAEAGKLATAEQIAALVRQRLQDDSPEYEKNPRIVQFFREYFHYPFAVEVFKDNPQGGEHDAQKLVGDLELTLKDILREDREVLAELLTTRDFYVNATLGRKETAGQIIERDTKTRRYQTAYNLPLDWKWGAHLQPVRFPEEERAGILTHPAWLAAWSGNFENHPVKRGKWIRTHLHGGTVPDVPIGVDARVPEMEHTSFRDRLIIATRAAECQRCHRKMDPLGLTFERFDHYGRLQRLDAGQPVVTTGAVTRTPFEELHGEVSGPRELMQRLAKSERVEQVFIRHAFRYFLGRNETLGDANTLQDAHAAYRNSGGSFNELVVSLLSSESFTHRRWEPSPE